MCLRSDYQASQHVERLQRSQIALIETINQLIRREIGSAAVRRPVVVETVLDESTRRQRIENLREIQQRHLILQRHAPDDDQVLTDVGRLTADPVEVLFTPHLVPMDRGILATIYATPKRDVTERELMDLFRNYYADCPFVRVIDGLPATKDSAFTNFFDMTVRLVRGRILIVACLDNLLKGAAGVAVQNFNLMNGLDETLGLI